jgi:hypothetical protein
MNFSLYLILRASKTFPRDFPFISSISFFEKASFSAAKASTRGGP